MASSKKYLDDIEAVLAKRHDNGADFWATQDGRWGVGSPFSTFDCALILSELGLQRSDPVMKGVANQILSAWREDGRFRASPKGAMHPCHTADAARALCHLGLRTTGCVERLTSKEKDGKVVVENPNRKLANLLFCKKGEPSELASKRMREIRKNLAAA